MGCGLDDVKIEHFIKNIFQFQLDTGARVTIIVNCENSHKSLKKGFKNKLLLKQIQSLLSTKQSQLLRSITTDHDAKEIHSESSGETSCGLLSTAVSPSTHLSHAEAVEEEISRGVLNGNQKLQNLQEKSFLSETGDYTSSVIEINNTVLSPSQPEEGKCF